MQCCDWIYSTEQLMLFALYVLKLNRSGNFLEGIRSIVVKARSKPERATKAKVWNVNGRDFICFWMRSSKRRARGGGDKERQKQTSWMALPELDPTSTLN